MAEAACPECDSAFDTNRGLRIHYGKKHDDPPPWRDTSGEFECPACSDKFDSKSGLHIHYGKRHDGSAPWEDDKIDCPECTDSFGSDRGLRIHYGYEHDDPPPWKDTGGEFECPECGDAFDTEGGRATHYGHKHDGSPPWEDTGGEFECDHCDRAFDSKRAARCHRTKIHTTRDDLLDALRELGDEDPPRAREMREHGPYDADTYTAKFGSWVAALEAAGFEPDSTQSRKNIPKPDLLDELRRVGGDAPPTKAEMHQHGEYSSGPYRGQFGSWGAALEAADYELGKNQRNGIPDDELLAELRRLGGDEPPTQAEMERNGRHWRGTYRERFGSWADALRAAGYEPHKRQRPGVSDEELLAELRELAGDTPPTARKVREEGEYYPSTYRVHFGSWHDALKAAGYDTRRKREPTGAPFVYEGNWPEQRRRAKYRDQARCQDCDTTDAEHHEEYGRGLDIHHKVPYREFDDPKQANELSNLVTLCRLCHNQRHNGT